MKDQQLQQLVFSRGKGAVDDAPRDCVGDVERMSICLQAVGYRANDGDIVAAWLHHSRASQTTWLALPDDDQKLVASLLEGTPPLLVPTTSQSHQWRVVLEDAKDGSGDQIFELPEELRAMLGWAVEDTLEITRLRNGDLLLHRVSSS